VIDNVQGNSSFTD